MFLPGCSRIRPARERPLYEAAIDTLVHLHSMAAPGWAQPYAAADMADLAALAATWYRAGILDGRDTAAEAEIADTLRPLLERVAAPHPVLILRDYHAENLIWLPQRSGIARVGLLDFQDAMLGHAAYDIVSLLEDARRDVSAGTRDAMIARYVDATGVDAAEFRAAFHVMGAQRNLRIVGVFARLCLRDGKPHYLDLIPRVWAHLMSDLDHPDLAALKSVVQDTLPPPDQTALQKLRVKCAKPPTP